MLTILVLCLSLNSILCNPPSPILTEKNDVVPSVAVLFPEISGQEGYVKYRIWDGKLENFSIPNVDARFVNMMTGIELSVKDVLFNAAVKGSVEIGKSILGKWIPVTWMNGEIRVTSETAALDVKLTLKGLGFVPDVSMNSKVSVDFSADMWMLYFLRSKIEKKFTAQINSEVPKKITEVIEHQVNPRLQKLKQEMISKGYTHYDIAWSEKDKIVSVAVRPKSSSKPNDKMLCVNVNMLTIMKEVTERLKGTTTETNAIDYNCVAPNFDCKGTSCFVSRDVDINAA